MTNSINPGNPKTKNKTKQRKVLIWIMSKKQREIFKIYSVFGLF